MAAVAGQAVTRVMHRCENAKASGYLDLSDCGLMYIADAIYHLLRGFEVNKCNLRNNQLTKFPTKMIERFKNMIVFNIEGNMIEEFPVEIGNWTEMKGINLANNKLTKFPDGIYNMQMLCFLDFSGNNIAEIDVERLYTALPNLTHLQLAGNPVAQRMKAQLENHERKPKLLNLVVS